ncbi:lipase member I-like [Petaurus breviceps papuanus]|uniref:lipase member I-like n=1 Tax=Petaurus breviceps papuanus TaxID=3040969 RepID=UPI0036DE96F2
MLYTREIRNCSQPLFTRNYLLNNKFKQKKKTVWIIHGYRPFGTSPIWLQKLITVLLSLEDLNIVVVDWNQGATTLLYQKAIQRTWTVSEILKDYIKKMRKYGISLQSFHFIGVSLGAHIAGYLGNQFGGLLGRITGIDPAGPGFNNVPVKMRLDYTDATFVDVIHSDANGLGITHSVGHIDFYPNGGKKQPGCPKSIFSGLSYIKCSHQRAIFLFLSSLSRKCNLTAYPCNSYEEYRNGKCIDCEAFGFSFCPITGYYADHWKNHIIERKPLGLNAFFDTSPKEPFCFYHYVLDIGPKEEIKKKGNIEIKLKDKHGIVEKSKIKRPRYLGKLVKSSVTLGHPEAHAAATAGVGFVGSRSLEVLSLEIIKGSGNCDKMTFPAHSETHILAGFYNDFKEISKVILKYIPMSSFFGCFKCQHQIQYIRLRSLNFPERQELCEEGILLEENIEIELNPHVCN